MPTWLAVTVTAALFAACLLAATRLGPGWAAWPLADRVNYLALCAAAFPWLLLDYLVTPPRWYTITAAAVAATSLAVFAVRQVRLLRQGRALLRRYQAAAQQHRRPDA